MAPTIALPDPGGTCAGTGVLALRTAVRMNLSGTRVAICSTATKP